jgi:peptidoglycan/xylan/chitin deacetylase (PgdA/CDA1 family)
VAGRPQVDDLLHVAPAALDFQELLAAQGDVPGGHRRVGGAQQVPAVEVLLGLRLRCIDAEQAAGGDPQVAVQARLGRDHPAEFGRWFRPSQTQYPTPLIEREARKAGYAACVSYDVDSLDYTDPGPDTIVSTVLGLTRPGSIISLHLGHPGTVTALPAIVRGLARRGLRPVTLTELLSP